MSIAKNFVEVRDAYLRDLANQDSTAHTHAGSDNFVRASAFAAVAEGLYQHQAWLLKQAFADSADSDYLEMHAVQYGIYRKAAAAAGGSVTLRGRDGSVIPAATTFTLGEVRYQTDSAVTISGGSATVLAHAVRPGIAGNSERGGEGRLVSPPSGVEAAVTVGAMQGGSDAEDDTALLARYLDRLRYPPAGGNARDFRRWCLEVKGVADAMIFPLRRGNGFVDAVILGAEGLPSAQTLAAVQAYVDERRPVTRKNGFLALAPTVQTVDVSLRLALVAGSDRATVHAAVTAAVRGYFAGLRPGEDVVRSQLEAVISGVAGVRDRAVTAPAANVSATVTASAVPWLRLGQLQIGDM